MHHSTFLRKLASVVAVFFVVILIVLWPDMTSATANNSTPSLDVLQHEGNLNNISEHYNAVGVNNSLDIPEEVREAIELAIQNTAPELLPRPNLKVVSLNIQEIAALATLATADESLNAIGVGDNAVLVILYKPDDSPWQAAIEGTDDFLRLLYLVPDTLLSADAKRVLDPSIDAPAQLASVDMRFPWDHTQSWMLTQGWHDGNSLDFAPATNAPNKWLLAAHDGVVVRVCNGSFTANLEVRHASGTKTTYVHLRNSSVPSAILGQSVAQGRLLGLLAEGSYNPGPCGNWTCQYRDECGNGTGPHVHFVLPAQTVSINGWALNTDRSLVF